MPRPGRKVRTKNPAVLFAEPAGKHCLKICKSIVAAIDAPRSPPSEDGTSGTLARSYKAKRSGTGAAVTTNVFYWRFQEFGWKSHEFGTRWENAQPHVRPAIELVAAANRGPSRRRRR